MAAASRRYAIIWLTILINAEFIHLASGINQQIQERARIQPLAKIQKAFKNEDVMEGLPDIVSNLGAIGTLAQIDYSEDPISVIKNVGDTLIPLIATGLALIPGGALIGGVMTAIWSIGSLLFGGKRECPIEKAINGLRSEIKDLRKTMKKLPAIILNYASKKTDETLKNIFNRAIHGEMSRNRYICSKYALISHDFSDDLKANRSINESRRIEMVATIHDCDNFLKDTAEAFVFPEYADVLWIPSVYATLTRVGFLTEICNYGISLQLDKLTLSMFWSEITTDLRRHFKYAAHGIEQRVRLAYEMKLPQFADRRFEMLLFRLFRPVELAACKAQSQLFYMNREMYPLGVPHKMIIDSVVDELNPADFNVTLSDEPRHIQIFYTDINTRKQVDYENLLNCIMGPLMQHIRAHEMTFRVSYVPNKSYQLRILYFTKKVEYRYEEGEELKAIDVTPQTSDRRLTIQEAGDTIKVVISAGKPNENNLKRFLWESGYNALQCIRIKYCDADAKASEGTFVIESAGIFNILKGDELKGKINIQVEPGEDDTPKATVILGAELIIRPAIQ